MGILPAVDKPEKLCEERMKRFIYFGLDTGLAALYGIAVIAVAARTLSLEQVGNLSLVIAMVTLQIAVVVFGFDKLVYARITRNLRRGFSITRHLVGLVLISGTVQYICGFFIAFFIAGQTIALLYSLAALRLVFSFSELLRAEFRAKLQPGAYMFARLASTTLAATLLFGTLLFEPSPYYLSFVWALEAISFSIILAVQYPSMVKPSFRMRVLKVSLQSSWPTFVQMVSVAFYYRFDQIYIGWRLSSEELAVYAVGARMAEAGNMFFGVIGLMVSPVVIEVLRAGQKLVLLRKTIIIFALSCILFISIVMIFGPFFLVFLFGDMYHKASGVLKIYAMASPFTVLGFIGSALAIACGAYTAPMASGLTSVAFCFVSTVLLVEYFGIEGGAIATLLTYAVAAFVVWWMALRRLRINGN